MARKARPVSPSTASRFAKPRQIGTGSHNRRMQAASLGSVHTSGSERSSILRGVAVGAMALLVVLSVAPATILAFPIEVVVHRGFGAVTNPENPGRMDLDWLAFAVGYATLCCCLPAYGWLRWRKKAQDSANRLADVVALFGVLLLLDPFLSLARYFSFQGRWWGLVAVSVFFVVWGCADRRRALGLVKVFLIAASVQAVYAIAYYALGIEQFQGARFGSRTGGTFGTPNPLYPLCLLAIPLSLLLGGVQNSSEGRWWYGMSAALNTMALLLTFTRTGWLGLLASGVLLVTIPASPFRLSQMWRVGMAICVVALLLGVGFVRTRGQLIGNPGDSSFWGRWQMWQVAARAVTDRPLLGSGIGTYAMQQRKWMTPQFEQFRPVNNEAKSLPLNVAVEMGLFGVALLAFGAVRCGQLHRALAASLPLPDEGRATATGIVIGFCGVAIAGLFDTPMLHADRFPSTLVFAVLCGVLCVLAQHHAPDAPFPAFSN